MKKNIIYLYPKTEEERTRLVEDYRYLGYYVTFNDERVTVNSIHPRKKREKEEKTPEREKSRRANND